VLDLHQLSGSEKPGCFFKKAQSTGLFGVLLVFGFYLVFRIFLSGKLLFRFASTLEYLKIRKFITCWSLEAVNINKSLIITGVT